MDDLDLGPIDLAVIGHPARPLDHGRGRGARAGAPDPKDAPEALDG